MVAVTLISVSYHKVQAGYLHSRNDKFYPATKSKLINIGQLSKSFHSNICRSRLSETRSTRSGCLAEDLDSSLDRKRVQCNGFKRMFQESFEKKKTFKAKVITYVIGKPIVCLGLFV